MSIQFISISSKILAILTPKERGRCYILGISLFVLSLLDIASLAYLVLVIDMLAHPASVAEWTHFLPSGKDGLLIATAILVLLFSFKNLLAYRINELQFSFVYGVAARLSLQNINSYLYADFPKIISSDTAVWIKKISQRPIEYAHYLLAGLQQAFSECCLLLIAITTIILYKGMVILWLLILLLPPLAILSYLTKRKIEKARRFIKSTGDTSLQYLKEALNSYVESNIYGRNIFFTERYHAQQKILNKYLGDLQSSQMGTSRLMEIFVMCALFILVLIQTYNGGTDFVNFATITAFSGFAYRCVPGIVRLFNINAQFKTYSFALNEVAGVGLDPSRINGKQPVSSINEIEMEDVHFNYGDKKVISGLRLKLTKGHLTCIAGSSGKGKTTLVNILLGFLEPYRGLIKFNGHTLDAKGRQQYWPHISYIKQQAFLFHDTLLTNISFREDGFEKTNLRKAIIKADCREVIKKNNIDLNFLLQENGQNISGGQKQRIALVRAFYKNADLLIADEPFNELDEKTITTLMTNFRKEADRGKMVLLITHNASCFSYCDEVITLNE